MPAAGGDRGGRRAWAEQGLILLVSVQWQGIDEQVAKAKREPPVKRPEPDPLAGVGTGQRLEGRLAGEGRDVRCTVVILSVSEQELKFRLETETGAKFRFECERRLGQLRVRKIVHVHAAGGGAKVAISDESGSGKVDGKQLVLRYSYRLHARQVKTMTGTIAVPL